MTYNAGKGYFQRTMEKIKLARSYGIPIGCICTFTTRSIPFTQEIFDFFAYEGLDFSIHGALPSLNDIEVANWTLSSEMYGKLLVEMLERYLPNLHKVRISTFDLLCYSVSSGKGGICTFTDCLGDYLAVGPEGNIYPCQRFAGIPDFRLGNVHESTSLEMLSCSSTWRMLKDRQTHIEEDCRDCSYLSFCQGGCPYNVLVARKRSKKAKSGLVRDPYCSAYKKIFSHITNRAMEEVFSEQNLNEVINHVDPKVGFLRRGKLISIMRKNPHPYETAQHSQRTLAAVVLAVTNSITESIRKFQQLGLVVNFERTEMAMRKLYQNLTSPLTGLNNLYLHITFACPLTCTHCYAKAGPDQKGILSVHDVLRACREAAELGFRHVVITGGEPLVHPERNQLLDALTELRKDIKPVIIVLRTSLSLKLDKDLLWRIGHSTDEVVVSIDGNRATHDERRGKGNYDLVVRNLRALVEMGYTTELSLATVLPIHLATGSAGDEVRMLAKELGIQRTRFRPILPLGRAIDSAIDISPETLWAHIAPHDMIAYGFNPTNSCGIGQNLYVEPDGGAYPCYAWHGKHWLLGYINTEKGIPGIITSSAFQALGKHTVNTNRQCQYCPLRYLCGGSCRAWNRQPEEKQNDLDTPPVNCSQLHKRAQSLLINALECLEISREQWCTVGLPLPMFPPKGS